VKKIVAALAVLVGSGLAWAGCSQNPPVVSVRSLERSGRAAFLCIRYPRERTPFSSMVASFLTTRRGNIIISFPTSSPS
jgi:hypothetical protein